MAAFWSADSLTTLDISYNEIGPKGAKEIAKSLSITGSLTQLYLWGNQLDEPAKAALRTAARPALNLRL